MKASFWASFAEDAFGSSAKMWKVEAQGRPSAPRDFAANELEVGLKKLGLKLKWVS